MRTLILRRPVVAARARTTLRRLSLEEESRILFGEEDEALCRWWMVLLGDLDGVDSP